MSRCAKAASASKASFTIPASAIRTNNSPSTWARQRAQEGGQNYVPSFITQYGPIREVRFQRKPDGTPDGGVHPLFTVVGRSDIGSSGCTAAVLPPTDFETQYRKGNLSFRIPLQTFGLGLIETIQDETILQHSAATVALRAPLGIGGIPNRSGNDGTISRFGWKA
jgi:hypothetical protein